MSQSFKQKTRVRPLDPDFLSRIDAIRGVRDAMRMVVWVGNDPERFDTIIGVILHAEGRTVQQASWVMTHCIDRHPDLLLPWIAPLLKRIRNEALPVGLKRNLIRSLQCVDIPRNLQGRVAQMCFDVLSNISESIAARVFSMTVLERLAAQEPDLQHELRLVIEQMMPYGTGAYHSRARHILRRLGPTTPPAAGL